MVSDPLDCWSVNGLVGFLDEEGLGDLLKGFTDFVVAEVLEVGADLVGVGG